MIGEVGVGVNRDCRHVELTAHRTSVEGFDVLELVDVLDALGIDLSVGERIEHECVVGIGAVREVDCPGHVFIPRLFRACWSALTMSSWCREYSTRFFPSSAFSAEINLRS